MNYLIQMSNNTYFYCTFIWNIIPQEIETIYYCREKLIIIHIQIKQRLLLKFLNYLSYIYSDYIR